MFILYLKDGNMEYYAKNGDLAEELVGQFYCIHRGYLINLFHMEGYDRTEVRMANGDKLNGLAGCDFAFHSKFCWEHDCRSGNGLLIVRIDTDAFVLFDEKPDLLWKIPMIALCIFAGEAALIYFWQRYRILLAERPDSE